MIIPTSNNFLLIFVTPTLYIYLLCVYSFLSSFLFILNEMYSIKGHIIRLLYLCPFHFFFTVLIFLNILYSYLLSGKIQKYKKIQIQILPSLPGNLHQTLHPKTHSLRNAPRLLISYTKLHKPVTNSNVARWIRSTLQDAGIEVRLFSAHSSRTVSTSYSVNA